MPKGLFQNAFYIGNSFNCILYGVQLVLFKLTVDQLVHLGSRRTRCDHLLIAFSSANLFLITIYVAVQSFFGQHMWIIDVRYPGGQAGYMEDNAAVWYQTMGTAASIGMNLLSDGLLIYRCFIVWGRAEVVILPCVLYLSALGLGIAELWASGTPHKDFFSGLAVQLGTSYYATSITLNAVVTCSITWRIVNFARISRLDLGPDVSKAYSGLAKIVVESALPYTLSGIAFLLSYGTGSELSILWLSFYAMFTCISPQMLVLRVVESRGLLEGQQSVALSSIVFQRPPIGSTGSDASIGEPWGGRDSTEPISDLDSADVGAYDSGIQGVEESRRTET
ncbi:hypothetical protein BV25DRAFT_1809843 [Artomyces pyxidatus]|uniref:Uncharacterized protein n=1 Tax=Artomyces pyxidatus TaxID=48021 RepID=A0ACB8SS31_9AGAM|nr:hypothetical protein BV25DRAFT_1809843 [Artomyces pyxidatus]